MNRIQVGMLRGECWYAMDVSRGLSMPIDKYSKGTINMVDGVFKNAFAPFLISNHGRYIWCEDGFILNYARGKIVCTNEPSKHSIDLYDGFGTLREAYLDAMEKHFPFSEEMPDDSIFRSPVYCTYNAFGMQQTEDDILSYARGILESGMNAGVITIDDGWQVETGSWEFDLTRIPQPKMMVDELHKMGFLVRLTINPFVSEDSDYFEYLKYSEMLVESESTRIAKRCWWNGRDAILDLSNPDALSWYKSKCDALMRDYGIDGFKFEGGEPNFYRNSDITYNAVDANAQSGLAGRMANNYHLGECRTCFKCGGLSMVVRNKNDEDGFKGLAEVVPKALMSGILGYPYCSADLVGGSNMDKMRTLKDDAQSMELLIRYAEAAALMPVLQYSLPVWKIPNKYVASRFKIASDVHEKYVNYVMSLVKNTAKTGEPIVRYLEYEFPHQGFHMVNNMFMLGSRYLVAPIVTPSTYKLKIRLPKGLWQYVDGKIYEGKVTVDAPLEVLPIFEKIR